MQLRKKADPHQGKRRERRNYIGEKRVLNLSSLIPGRIDTEDGNNRISNPMRNHILGVGGKEKTKGEEVDRGVISTQRRNDKRREYLPFQSKLHEGRLQSIYLWKM